MLHAFYFYGMWSQFECSFGPSNDLRNPADMSLIPYRLISNIRPTERRSGILPHLPSANEAPTTDQSQSKQQALWSGIVRRGRRVFILIFTSLHLPQSSSYYLKYMKSLWQIHGSSSPIWRGWLRSILRGSNRDLPWRKRVVPGYMRRLLMHSYSFLRSHIHRICLHILAHEGTQGCRQHGCVVGTPRSRLLRSNLPFLTFFLLGFYHFDAVLAMVVCC